MLPARWRLPVIAVALTFGTTGGLATSISQALAAHPVLSAPAHRPSVTRLAHAAAKRRAPLVTDVPAKSKRGLAAPKLIRAMRLADKLKQASARAYLRRVTPPATRMLASTAQAQIRNYFCGPAAVSEMLAQVGVKVSQRAAARQLGTNTSGTDWSDASGYPVPKVLNAHQHETSYVAVALPWVPTTAQISTFEKDLVTDLNRGAGVPLAGNAYEVPGGPHLVGHPAGQQIMHWFDIRGYSRSGAVTSYEDSVHGAPSIAWSTTVPAYSSLPSATVADIVGARGYVW